MRIVNPIGKKGEDIAVAYLKKKGYRILERNYRKQYAEIDIVATHDNILVFVEVKTRTSNKFGSPFEAITKWKLQPLIKASQHYQITHPALPNEMRVDAIGVELYGENGHTTIEHLENIAGF